MRPANQTKLVNSFCFSGNLKGLFIPIGRFVIFRGPISTRTSHTQGGEEGSCRTVKPERSGLYELKGITPCVGPKSRTPRGPCGQESMPHASGKKGLKARRSQGRRRRQCCAQTLHRCPAGRYRRLPRPGCLADVAAATSTSGCSIPPR